jgi:ribose transport system substrate-binding protein
MRSITFGAAVLSAALVLTACGGSATQNVDAQAVSPGCPENAARIAELQDTLSKNLYGIAAADSGKTQHSDPEPLAPGAPIKLTFSIEGLSHPFLVRQQQLATEKARELGVQLDVVSANDDVNKQFNDIQNAIAAGSNGIVMMPANTQGLNAVLQQAQERNIAYSFSQKGMLGVEPATQALAPYALEGKTLGEWVVQHYAGQQDVKVALISGITGDQSSVARTGSFELELLKSCNFDIVAEQPGQYRRDASAKAAESILAAHPDLKLMFGANDEAALGALSAIEASGRQGIDVVGLDGQTEMFEALKAGKALATVKHLPTADKAVEETVKYLRGEPVPTYVVELGDLVTADDARSGSVQPAF